MHADNTTCIVYEYHVRDWSGFFTYFTRVTFVRCGNLVVNIYIYALVTRFESESTDRSIVSMQLILPYIIRKISLVAIRRHFGRIYGVIVVSVKNIQISRTIGTVNLKIKKQLVVHTHIGWKNAPKYA